MYPIEQRSCMQAAYESKDLTAYTIVGEDPLQLEECCVGEGMTHPLHNSWCLPGTEVMSDMVLVKNRS